MRSERERILNLESSLIGNTVLLLRTSLALVELIQAIDKFVQAEIRKHLQPLINQLLREPVESTNWRLDRAVRRIIRRDILRDCRVRSRAQRKAKVAA